MAKNTKGDGSLEQNGSTVVTPDNIGQGIKWNSATKKYDVQIAQNQPIIINDNGELEVRVSKLENNQLRLMKDGLYYGNQARPELANLYVDAVNGVDQDPLKVQGAGTRAKPLKTVDFAVTLGESGTDRAIWLREGQTHNVTRYAEIKEGILSFRPYGEIIDMLMRTEPNDSAAHEALHTKHNKQPILSFYTGEGLRRVVQEEGLLHVNTLVWYTLADLYFDGVSIELDMNYDFTKYDSSLYNRAGKMRMSRILCSSTGSVYFTRGQLLSTGTPKYSAIVSESFCKTANGLYQMGLAYSSNSAITIYSSLNTDANYSLFTEPGWNSLPTGSASYNTSDKDYMRKFVAPRIAARLDENYNGVKRMIAPSTNIPQEYFFK